MTDEFSFSKIYSAENAAMDLIFIHGLTGDPKDTWVSESGTKEFWPSWLHTEMPNTNVYTLGYPTSIFGKWAKKEMDIFERATSALDYMAAKGIGERPIAFITHSLGGILAKTILRKSCDADDDDWKSVSEKARLIVFLATPHTGASLASVLKTAIPRFSSKHVELLSNDIGSLEDINSHYRTYANNKADLKTVAYYEKYKTKDVAIVVSRESSDPGVSGTQPVPTDKDHTNICKPRDKDDPVYAGIQRHLKLSLKAILTATPLGDEKLEDDDYSSKASHDRRDLLTKLIAAGREHEYEMANNYQNGFARNYLKLGLHTPAKEKNDKLLSEIEQRFVTHIYHPLICKGGSEEEIRISLQSKVIDPICQKREGEKGITEKTVLRGLYFLTEQCHIRWDVAS